MIYTEGVTNRGFKIIHFYDSYNELCTIQESSNIDPHIWLGTSKSNPKIMIKGKGWVDYELPDDVLISHRMHLNKKQCISLGFKLLKFGLFGKI